MAVRPQDWPEDEPRDPALDRGYAAGPREEPPLRLDEAILAAARREVRAGPRAPGSRLRPWRGPLALAAVLVLSVSVVLLMREEGAERLADAPASVGSPVPSAAPERASEEAPAAPEQAQNARQPKPESGRPKATTATLRDAPEAAAEEDRRKAEAYYREENRQRAAREEPRASPRPFAEPPSAPAEPKLAAPEAAPPPADALAKRAQAGAASGQAVERAEREQQPAQRPAAPPATQAPPAAVAPDSSVGSLAQQAPDFRRAAPEAGAAMRGTRDDVAAASRPVWQGYDGQPPEKWLERVEELHRAGRAREAREMLAEFRKRFPQHPVPATLER